MVAIEVVAMVTVICNLGFRQCRCVGWYVRLKVDGQLCCGETVALLMTDCCETMMAGCYSDRNCCDSCCLGNS